MSYAEIREKVAEVARQMYLRGLVHGTSGNVSARADDGCFAVTPTGMDYDRFGPSDIVVIDDGTRVVHGHRRPTSEVPMHLGVYRHRPQVTAIVHTHSDMATTLAVLGEDLPAAHYILALAGTRIRCARYATYGTAELAANALDALGTQNAALLANHGVLAIGTSLEEALGAAEAVEVVAGYYYRARCIGSPKLLDDAEMARVIEAFRTYGQPT